jgi:hypothetical protein
MEFVRFSAIATYQDEDQHIAVCPLCKKLWLDDELGFGWDFDKPYCRHLRFFAFSEDPGDDILFFNGFTPRDFILALEPACRKLCPTEEELRSLNWIHSHILFERKTWMQVFSSELDTVMILDFGTMTTGVGLFGAKLHA